ncbi:hypothetical protein [Sphingomonas quercus]|uniref:Lipoprotein n=1 Tax=Sphingomonas quercus TaxID=2842451 RepID=A0ABS6BE88_9SPHN|nr:hypothetical protein [Sphingomonas quercus]MBU3076635.1 hypothetical protein [Sphingomonas quercus]
MRILLLTAAALALAGCVRTAANIVTFPVRAGSQVVDWSTTSQEEADRNRGREMRKQEEREAKERRKEEKEARRRERDAGR